MSKVSKPEEKKAAEKPAAAPQKAAAAAPEKPVRTLEQVEMEYHKLCLKAGHTQYSIDVQTRDLKVLNDTLRDLNFEAASLQAKRKQEEAVKAQKEAEDARAKETKNA